jgi:hypothetical protein
MKKPSVAPLRQSISRRLEREIIPLIKYEYLEGASWFIEKFERDGVTRVCPDLHERLIRIIVDVWKLDPLTEPAVERDRLKRLVERVTKIKEEVEDFHPTIRSRFDAQHLIALDGLIATAQQIEPAREANDVIYQAAHHVIDLLADINGSMDTAPKLTTAVVGIATGKALTEGTVENYCKKVFDSGIRFERGRRVEPGTPRRGGRPPKLPPLGEDLEQAWMEELERDRLECLEAMRLWRPVPEILDELLPER